MAVSQTHNISKSGYLIHRLYFSTSCPLNNKWRLKQGLEPNPNKYGPIKILPDYSFLDGKPVPLSFAKVKQMEHQQKLCQRIIELNNELDAGLQKYYESQEQKNKARSEIIQNKLKPKGSALLKKNRDQK